MITEIYVSIDGIEYTNIDLFKDETFVMKYSKKELQDITKVFSPFSQDFSFPATPKNNMALGFFGNTEVIKINIDNKYKCKTYTKGVLNQTGVLKIHSVKYKNGKASSITGSFNTNLLSLKDRMGNDTLNDLSTDENLISWRADNVFKRLKSTATVNGLKYYVPLYSNNRVLNYNNAVTAIDNVAYKSTNNPLEDKVINIGELRPCVSMISLLNLIKTKYNLTINTPLEDNNELKEAYVWCNGANFGQKASRKFIIKKQFSNQSPSQHGTAVTNLTDSSVLITKSNTVSYITYMLRFNELVIGDSLAKAQLKIELVSKTTGMVVYQYDHEVTTGDNTLIGVVPLYLFNGNQLDFYTYVKFSKPVFWKNTDSTVFFRNSLSDKISFYENNFNNTETNCFQADLVQALPNTKVIDFLTSYFKTFNLSIFDSSPNNEDLFLLTPADINTPNKTYSKSEVDYTRYADGKEVSKTVGNEYNYYNLKHKTSSYRSNLDFKKQFGAEYGQIFYPAVKPAKANEFKVETEFSIIPPVLINGHPTAYTAYGFTAETPEVDDLGRFRYSPNYEETTLFYSHGSTSLANVVLGCQDVNALNVLVNSPLDSYIKTMPYCKQNNYSLGFSILVINGISYSNTLYSLYYSQLVSRLLNPNALSHKFTLILPSSEIYLNDANVQAGTGLTPKGFRLQNEVIINETKYEILDASIDNNTGKTILTLLNFT